MNRLLTILAILCCVGVIQSMYLLYKFIFKIKEQNISNKYKSGILGFLDVSDFLYVLKLSLNRYCEVNTFLFVCVEV